MKVFKLNEGWDDGGLGPLTNLQPGDTKTGATWAASHYLVNRDVENLNTVKAFCNVFKLEEKVLAIYNYGKDILNTYPSKITDEEILYITKDGCKVIIKIENGLVTSIKKEKALHDHTKGFTKETIEECPFSMEKFKYLMHNEVS